MMEEEGKGEPPALGPHRKRLLPDLGTRQCFSCKACYSLCDRGSKKRLAKGKKKNPNPIPPPWVCSGAEREQRDAVGPPHVEQIAFKRRERHKERGKKKNKEKLKLLALGRFP